MYHSYVTMHFVEAHELRLSGVIIFIEYLITKGWVARYEKVNLNIINFEISIKILISGFINHACDVIFVLLSTDYSANTLLTKKDIDKRIFNLLRRVMQCYIDNLYVNLNLLIYNLYIDKCLFQSKLRYFGCGWKLSQNAFVYYSTEA